MRSSKFVQHQGLASRFIRLLRPIPLLLLGRLFFVASGFGITGTIFARLYRSWGPPTARWQSAMFSTQLASASAYAALLVILSFGFA